MSAAPSSDSGVSVRPAAGGLERLIAVGRRLFLFGAHAGGALVQGFALGALALEAAADIALLAEVLHAYPLALVELGAMLGVGLLGSGGKVLALLKFCLRGPEWAVGSL